MQNTPSHLEIPTKIPILKTRLVLQPQHPRVGPFVPLHRRHLSILCTHLVYNTGPTRETPFKLTYRAPCGKNLNGAAEIRKEGNK